MERKGKVIQSAVNAACEELEAAGKAVTVSAVIEVTGGSFSTVGPMVKVWREEQAAQASAVLEMPDAVALAMQKAAADISNGADVADTLDAAVDDIDRDIEDNNGYQ